MKKLLLITILISLAGCKYSYSFGENDTTSEIGRYQILRAANDVDFLLDTKTGAVWKYVFYEDQNDPSLYKAKLGWLWEPTQKFDDRISANYYINQLQQAADQQRLEKGRK